MIPPKKWGTAAVSIGQGQKSFRRLLQNHVPFYLPTHTWLQEGNVASFLMLNLPCGHVRALNLSANRKVCWAKHLPCSIKLLLDPRFKILW